jgi:glycosyltransferase involved in cell wall biosynthesis
MSKKIKILRIINRFNLGGPTYNATFLSAFVSDKFETKLIGGKHEEYEGESLFIPHKYDVNPQIIDSLQREINFKSDRKTYKEIRKIIQDYKPDIVHTHASKSGAIGRLAAFKENVPVVVHTFHGHVFHSYFGKLKTKFYKVVERYLARKSTAIVVISDLQKSELVSEHKIIKNDKAKVINLGFDLTKFQTNIEDKRKDFSAKWNIQEDEICIGIIGRLTHIKNHDLFFKVIDQTVSNTTKKIRVFVIGDGELNAELKEKSKAIEEKLNKKIFTFTSWIKNVDVALARLDIVCLTSFNEGTPVSLIEAQAANVVVLSTDVGGVKDIVKNGETGFVIDDFSVENFSKKLLDLIENEEKRKIMSQNGWGFVRNKFHYTTLCANMEKLYLDLLQNKK